MKTLIYKIIKHVEPTEHPVIEFNHTFYLNELKKEIGLPEIPYENLTEYKVQLNSPTGRSCSFEINAKEYVDKELLNIEKSIQEANAAGSSNEEEITFDIITVKVDESQEASFKAMVEKSEDFWEWVNDTPPIKEVKMETPLDKFKYYDVKVNDMSYTVVLFEDGRIETTDQINTVRKHFATIGERNRDMLTGLEFVINYFQWVNLVSNLDNPNKPDYLSYEDISKRMDTIFQGVEGLDLPMGLSK